MQETTSNNLIIEDFQDESYIINEDHKNDDEKQIKAVTFSNDFTLKDYYVAKQKYEITCVAFNTRQKIFVFLDENGISTWEWKKFDRSKRINRIMNFSLKDVKSKLNLVNIIYGSIHNCYFALRADNVIIVYNRDFHEIDKINNSSTRSILYMVYNPVNDELLTCDSDGIKVWSLVCDTGFNLMMANYKLVLKKIMNISKDWIRKIDIDTDNYQLYCCTNSDLYIYDFNGRLIRTYLEVHRMTITCCVYSPKSKLVITASADTTIKVWSLIGGLTSVFKGHTKAVTKLLLNPKDSNLVISSSLDGFIKIWSLDIMQQIYEFYLNERQIITMGFTNENFLYVSCSLITEIFSIQNFLEFWSNPSERINKIWLNTIKNKRLVTIGEESTIRLFRIDKPSQITVIMPMPIISREITIRSVCYSRLNDTMYVLLTNDDIWVYYTKSSPSTKIAIWNTHRLQDTVTKAEDKDKPSHLKKMDLKNKKAIDFEIINKLIKFEKYKCHSVGILDSQANYWTFDGLNQSNVETFLMLGLENGMILFCDTLINGKKYFTLNCGRDPIIEIEHDSLNNYLIVKIELKKIYHIQYWSLPDFVLKFQSFCSKSMTSFARLEDTVLYGFNNGGMRLEPLIYVEEDAQHKLPNDFEIEELLKEETKYEHRKSILNIDSCHKLKIFLSSSDDGNIKVWDSLKNLICEINLNTEITCCKFLNSFGDLIIGWRDNLFKIPLHKLVENIKDRVSQSITDTDMLNESLQDDSYIIEDDYIKFDQKNQELEVVEINMDKYLHPFKINLKQEQIIHDVEISPLLEDKLALNNSLLPPEKNKIRFKQDIETLSLNSFVDSLPSINLSTPRENPLNELRKIDLTLTSEINEFDLKACLVDLITEYHVANQTEKIPENWAFPKFGISPRSTPSCTPPLESPKELKHEIVEIFEHPVETTSNEVEEVIVEPIPKLKPPKIDDEEELERKLRERLPDFSNKNSLQTVKINSKSLIETYNNQISKQNKFEQKSKKSEKENIDINQRTTKKRNKIFKTDKIDSEVTKSSSTTTRYSNSIERFQNKQKPIYKKIFNNENSKNNNNNSNKQENIRKRSIKTSSKSSRKSSASSFSISKATSASWHSSMLENDVGKDENLNNTKVTNYSSMDKSIDKSIISGNIKINKTINFQTKTNPNEIEKTSLLHKSTAVTSSTSISIGSKLSKLTSSDNGEIDLNKVKALYDFKYGINSSIMNQPYKRITSGLFKLPFETDSNKTEIKNEVKETILTTQQNDQESLESKSTRIFDNKHLLNWLQNYDYQRRKLNRRMNKVLLKNESIQKENLKRWSESISRKNSTLIARPLSANKQLLQLDSNSKISFQHSIPSLIQKIEPRNIKSASPFRQQQESSKESQQLSNTKRPKSVTFAINNFNKDSNSEEINLDKNLISSNNNNNDNKIKPIIHLQSGYLISQIEMEDILKEVEERINTKKLQLSKKSSNEIVRNINLHSNLSFIDIWEITDSESDENETSNIEKKNRKPSAKTVSTSSITKHKPSLKINANKEFMFDNDFTSTSHRFSFRSISQTKNLDSSRTKKSNALSQQSQNSDDDADEYYYYCDTNSSEQTRNKKPVRARTPASIPNITPTSINSTTNINNNNNNISDYYSQLNIEYKLPNSIERFLLPVRFPILYRNIIKNLYRLKSGNQFKKNNSGAINQFTRVNSKSFTNKVN